ncbi:hypothetical protein MRX96_018451 [Rhipicephalus microplus]
MEATSPTAFFKHNTLKDLFGTDFDLAIAEKGEEAVREDRPTDSEKPEKFSSVEFEKALGMAEEELDVQAAHTARAEAAAELAEFDESIPLDTDSRDEDKSQAEEELDKLMDQATVDATTEGLATTSVVTEPVQSLSAVEPSNSCRVRLDTIYRQQSDLEEERAKAEDKLSELSAAATERKRGFVVDGAHEAAQPPDETTFTIIDLDTVNSASLAFA